MRGATKRGGEKETASESKTSTKSGGADDWNIPAETAGFKPDGWNRGKFDSRGKKSMGGKCLEAGATSTRTSFPGAEEEQ